LLIGASTRHFSTISTLTPMITPATGYIAHVFDMGAPEALCGSRIPD
jgi:hypothetical protein